MKKMLLFIALLASSHFYAQGAPVNQAMQQCKQVENALKRLACYDSLAKQMGSNEPLPTQSDVMQQAPVVNNRPALVTQPAASGSDFGLEKKQVQKQEQDSVRAAVASVKKNAHKKLTLTLTNGQVWRQTDSTYLRIKADDEVIIERAALGSFLLKKVDTNKRMRVKRVK